MSNRKNWFRHMWERRCAGAHAAGYAPSHCPLHSGECSCAKEREYCAYALVVHEDVLHGSTCKHLVATAPAVPVGYPADWCREKSR